MANQLYGYSHSTSYTAPSTLSPAGAPKTAFASVYGTGVASLSDPYLPESTLRYLPRSESDHLSKYSSSLGTTFTPTSSASAMYPHLTGTTSHLGYSQLLQHQDAWPPGVDVSSGVEPLPPGVKRSSDALYYPTILGAHNTIGQIDAWYTTEYLTKRSRVESASNLPIYPQRPGEKDCTHYMQTRTCRFGDSCKFDHPIWVPEGGIPDWKEAPLAAAGESYPERPGEPDCPYFMKTQRCKYGSKCKFNHPKDKLAATGPPEQISALPDRPSEPPCSFYMKTGKCKFGTTCKFNHPKDIQIPSAGQENGCSEQYGLGDTSEGIPTNASAAPRAISTPAPYHNSKGLPIRPGEVDCPFYLKTGSCKYGATCRYNHPDRNAFIPPVAAIGHPLAASAASNYSIGVVNPAASLYQTHDPRLAQTTQQMGMVPTIYPQRPGQAECDYYMKTGECKFGERCRFHHPIDRTASATKQASQQGVKLTLAGLPRREGAAHCPYYMKTGTCKYGATCKFDHPPPGEVMSVAASQGASTSAEAEDGQGR